LLPDACGAPGIYGPGRSALGHIPFYRAIECCDRACADPSNCPPQTRDRFERAIQLDDRGNDAVCPAAQDGRTHRQPDTYEPTHMCERERIRASHSSAPRLGEVLPVRDHKTTKINRTVTRFVTAGLPGRLIDLVV